MTFLLMAMTFAAPVLASDGPPFVLSSPVCNSGWTVSQRYDERRADGVIWKATWIARCIPQPKVKWKKRVNQIRRS